MAQIDVVNALAHDQVHDEAEIGPADESVGIVAIALRIAVDVGIREDIELILAAATRRVEREQNGPGDAASDKADDDGHAQVAQVEERVKGLVLEGVDIGNLPKRAEPVE